MWHLIRIASSWHTLYKKTHPFSESNRITIGLNFMTLHWLKTCCRQSNDRNINPNVSNVISWNRFAYLHFSTVNNTNSPTFIWKLRNLSELTHITFNMELTHLGSEASIYYWKILKLRMYLIYLNFNLWKLNRLIIQNGWINTNIKLYQLILFFLKHV